MIYCLPISLSWIFRAAPRNFHARHDARSRVYIYQISQRKQAFTKRYVWWVKEELDIKAMQAATVMLVGRHRLSAFVRRTPRGPRVDDRRCRERQHRNGRGHYSDPDRGVAFLWRMLAGMMVGVIVKVGKREVA